MHEEMSRFLLVRGLVILLLFVPLHGTQQSSVINNAPQYPNEVSKITINYEQLYQQENICFRIEKLVKKGGVHANLLLASPILRSSDFEATRLTLLVSAFVPTKANFHHLEIDEVLCANLANPSFAEVHVLLQGSTCRNFRRKFGFPNKMVCVEVQAQPHYWDFFHYASEKLASRVVVLANGDILFDTSLQRLKHNEMNGSFAFVLSTDSARANSLYEHLYGVPCDTWSHCSKDGVQQHSWDAFIFRSPLPWPVNSASYTHQQIKRLLNVVMNTPGAENRAAFGMQLMGLRILNPCDHLHALHWHCGPLTHHKTGSPRVYVPPRPKIKSHLTRIYHDLAAAQKALRKYKGSDGSAQNWVRAAQKRLRFVLKGQSSHIKTYKCIQDCPAINY